MKIKGIRTELSALAMVIAAGAAWKLGMIDGATAWLAIGSTLPAIFAGARANRVQTTFDGGAQ